MIIYRATNKTNGLQYIGQCQRTLSERLAEHKYDSKRCSHYFANAIRKYNMSGFTWEIIEDGIETLDELCETETKYILDYDTIRPNGYNILTGGTHMTQEIRNKISESLKGNIPWNKGKSQSIRIGNSVFDSAYEAADHFSVTFVTIYNWVKTPNKDAEFVEVISSDHQHLN